MILTGDPGIGKTAIAAQLTRFSTGDETPPADYIHIRHNFLSGFHFCSARNGGWISPESFTRSLSSQFSMRYPEFVRVLSTDPQIHIEQHIEKNLGSAIGMWIENYYAESSEVLFNKLIRRPLHVLCKSGEVSAPLVILIDGLDEALNYSGRLTIINLLGVLTASLEPVDALMLSQWTGLNHQQVNDALYDLQELLDPALDERYRIYHESVVDFLTGDNAGPYYIDAFEYHRQIVQSYIGRFGDKSKANREDCDQYGLRYVPAHLFRARQKEDLNKLLLDFDWMLAKLEV